MPPVVVQVRAQDLNYIGAQGNTSEVKVADFPEELAKDAHFRSLKSFPYSEINSLKPGI